MGDPAAADDRIELMCPVCRDETVHDVQYAGRLVLAVRCTVCGTQTRDPSPHVVTDYVADLGNRLATKPGRLWRRLRRHPVATVRESVVGLVRQPGKLAREARAVHDARRRNG